LSAGNERASQQKCGEGREEWKLFHGFGRIVPLADRVAAGFEKFPFRRQAAGLSLYRTDPHGRCPRVTSSDAATAIALKSGFGSNHRRGTSCVSRVLMAGSFHMRLGKIFGAVGVLLFVVAGSYGQSLGDVARQQREKTAKGGHAARKVVTN